jgi:hypothetical protein
MLLLAVRCTWLAFVMMCAAVQKGRTFISMIQFTVVSFQGQQNQLGEQFTVKALASSTYDWARPQCTDQHSRQPPTSQRVQGPSTREEITYIARHCWLHSLTLLRMFFRQTGQLL